MATTFRPWFAARRSILRAFPNLRGKRNWRLKSPWSDTYQCVAWALCRSDRKWWPLSHSEFDWFPGLPRVVPPPMFPPVPLFTPVSYLIQGFERVGYAQCATEDFEFGYQKVAIYANQASGATHMARQSISGDGWLSKPGFLEDIRHATLADIGGNHPNGYGDVAQILKRSWLTALSHRCGLRCLTAFVKIRVLFGVWMLVEATRKLV
jgi:hypothetical protein